MSSNNSNILSLLLIILAGGGYFGYTYLKTPCSSPTTYKIGTFDERFNISQDDFLSTVQEAVSIWEKPLGIDLFNFNQTGKITVNLVYDDRQKTTVERSLLQADAQKIKQLANSVKAEYTSLEDDYALHQKEYEALLTAYNIKQKSYNEKVDYWNKQGGAPNKEYNELVSQKNSLSQDFNFLESKRQEVNSLIKQINEFIDKYNLLINNVNKNIDTINETAGTEFQEGTYDPSSKTITIYEFESRTKLERVLAHEFGHALGLDHNPNKQSIMYEVNQANTMVLSDDDIGSLKTKCRLN